MTDACSYVRDFYGVPAEIGRRVIAHGRPGIIAADRGNYIGVNLDSDEPGVISNFHPTDQIEYLEMRAVRKASKGAARYQRYLEYGECFRSFIEFCRWDASTDRSWNSGQGTHHD